MDSHLEYIFNNTDAPKWIRNNMCYATIVGSVAYACNSNQGERSAKVSDLDIYSFCMPPKDQIFPHQYGYLYNFGDKPVIFENWQKHHIINKESRKEYDIVIFSIVRYFDLLMQNNPNMIDSIYTAENLVLYRNVVGEMVRAKRNIFLSKACQQKFIGYAFSQLRKLNDFIHSGSAERQDSINKVGYDVKKAYHIVRLLLQTEQILTEHDLDLQRNAEILKDIRAGHWELDEIKNFFSKKRELLDTIVHSSTLRQFPDEEEIKQLLLNCIEHHYGSISSADIIIPNKHITLIQELEQVIERYKK